MLMYIRMASALELSIHLAVQPTNDVEPNTKMKLFQAMTGLLPACLALAVACGLAGCAVGEVVVGGTMRAANQIDAARTHSHGNNLLAKHLQTIKDLQAKGDPLGDYMWVAANARGWVDNPELDPEKLRDMYAAAAAKGSSDAMVALGMMYVSGQTTQQSMAGKRLDDSKLDLEKGLRLVEEGTRERC